MPRSTHLSEVSSLPLRRPSSLQALLFGFHLSPKSFALVSQHSCALLRERRLSGILTILRRVWVDPSLFFLLARGATYRFLGL